MVPVEGTATGAPWWLTLTLPVITAIVTHHLTLYRERLKSNRDWHQRWHDDAKKQVAKVSNAAIEHFVDEDSISKTPVSAHLIIAEVKRLRSCIHEATCVNASDSKQTSDALRAFDDAITAEEDFQDPARTVRRNSDPVCQRILHCEQMLLNALLKPRKRRAD